MRLSQSNIVASLVFISSLGACAPHAKNSGEKDGASSTNAIVTADQFAQSYDIIKGIDYLPFNYVADGCYARALYMSMELAVKGIPSTAIFAFADDKKPLEIKDGTQWGYHVAPMLKKGADGEETIIDPAMGEGSHLAMTKWISNMELAGTKPAIARVQGSWYGPAGVAGRMDPLISSLDQMEGFKTGDIESACDTVYKYLDLDPVRSAQESDLRVELLSKTGDMLKTLNELGKLDNSAGLTELSCGNQAIQVPESK